MPVGTRPEPPVHTARVAISGTILGHRWTQVFWLLLTASVVTVNDLADLAVIIDTAWNTDIKPQLSADVHKSEVAISYIPSAGNVLNYAVAVSTNGTLAGTTIDDASACHVVDYIIGDRYRGGHPRSYFPGVVVADVANGSDVSGARQAAVVAAVNAFRNAINAGTTTNITVIVMGVVRFVHAKAWLTPPVFREFTSVKYGNQGKLGSQRRRIKN